MDRGCLRFIRCRRGAAAAEMALVTPLLVGILFGSVELGRYFLDQHVVVKAVRDGARYAARRDFADYAACSGAPGGTVAADTRNLVRTGRVAAGGIARLGYWPNTSPYGITISVSCAPTVSSPTPGAYGGIYENMDTGAPVVTVTASVPYQSLFGTLGMSNGTLTLNATSQAAVMGI